MVCRVLLMLVNVRTLRGNKAELFSTFFFPLTTLLYLLLQTDY